MHGSEKKRAAIIQPGAIGDCVLTLPLAEFLKERLDVDFVQLVGKSEYTAYLPGRSSIDSIRDIDSIDLHRLFMSRNDFELEDGDSLITAFAGFEYIISFLGEAGSDFEHNLIYTAYCSKSADIKVLPPKPNANDAEHTAVFHIQNFLAYNSHHNEIKIDGFCINKNYLSPYKSDFTAGQNIVSAYGISPDKKIILIHPGSGGEKKQWHIDNFLMAAQQLSEVAADVQPVFLLGQAELEKFSAGTIARLAAFAPVVCDKTLKEVFQIISVCSCFIGNDSGITHIAAAAGVPTLACFGASNPVHYAPLGGCARVFEFEQDDFAQPSPQKAGDVADAAVKFLTKKK